MTNKPKVGRPRKDPTVVLHYRVPEKVAPEMDTVFRAIAKKQFKITLNKKK